MRVNLAEVPTKFRNQRLNLKSSYRASGIAIKTTSGLKSYGIRFRRGATCIWSFISFSLNWLIRSRIVHLDLGNGLMPLFICVRNLISLVWVLIDVSQFDNSIFYTTKFDSSFLWYFYVNNSSHLCRTNHWIR